MDLKLSKAQELMYESAAMFGSSSLTYINNLPRKRTADSLIALGLGRMVKLFDLEHSSFASYQWVYELPSKRLTALFDIQKKFQTNLIMAVCGEKLKPEPSHSYDIKCMVCGKLVAITANTLGFRMTMEMLEALELGVVRSHIMVTRTSVGEAEYLF